MKSRAVFKKVQVDVQHGYTQLSAFELKTKDYMYY